MILSEAELPRAREIGERLIRARLAKSAGAPLVRPRISWPRWLALFAGLFACLLLPRLALPPAAGAAAGRIAALLLLFLLRRQIAIGLIRLYQRFAPARVRRRCVCTPSCSAYMIEAIRSCGLWRGGLAGVTRMLRCGVSVRGSDPFRMP